MKKKLKFYFMIPFLRVVLWISYKLGMYRSISSTKILMKDFNKEQLIEELNYLINIIYLTGLDSDYLKKIIKNRLSSLTISAAEMANPEGKYKITSDPEEQKKIIEDSFSINIEKTEYGFKYSGITIYLGDIDYDNLLRLQLSKISVSLLK